METEISEKSVEETAKSYLENFNSNKNKLNLIFDNLRMHEKFKELKAGEPTKIHIIIRISFNIAEKMEINPKSSEYEKIRLKIRGVKLSSY